MLFMHIPMPEYVTLFNEYPYYGTKICDVSCWSVNTGLFAAIVEHKTVKWVSVGHNHSNDFYGLYHGVTLGYGRKSGFAGSTSRRMPPGVRVFEVTLNESG